MSVLSSYNMGASSLARVKERRGRLEEIDGLRAIAISLVVLFHYTKDFFPDHRFFSFGWSGVDLFFVISGFVLYYQVKRRYCINGKVDYLTYFRNRALRIIPAYYVSLFATVLCFGMDKILSEGFLMHLTFLYIFDYNVAVSIQPLYWTLAVEMQFYIFLILFAPLMTGKDGMKWLAGLIVINILYRMIFALFYSPSSNTGLVLGNILPGRISEFSYGMIIAKIYMERTEGMRIFRRPAVTVSIVILSVFILAVCWAIWLRMGDSVLNDWLVNTVYYPMIGLGYALLFLIVLIIPILSRAASLKPVAFIGNISYSIYLWHVFVMKIVGEVMSGPLAFFTALITTIIISSVSYYLVERTFLRFKA